MQYLACLDEVLAQDTQRERKTARLMFSSWMKAARICCRINSRSGSLTEKERLATEKEMLGLYIWPSPKNTGR